MQAFTSILGLELKVASQEDNFKTSTSENQTEFVCKVPFNTCWLSGHTQASFQARSFLPVQDQTILGTDFLSVGGEQGHNRQKCPSKPYQRGDR